MCQNLSFPTVVGSEIQALFFTPFLDALSAGSAFEDPLFPDGRLLGDLKVDCDKTLMYYVYYIQVVNKRKRGAGAPPLQNLCFILPLPCAFSSC